MSLTGRLHLHRQLVLGDEVSRDVTVYLPPGVDPTSSASLPVLVLQDGQNLFAANPGPFDTWALDATADRLIRTGRLDPLVIVGVGHQGVGRIAEYTPTVGAQGGGGAAGYARFLVDDLLPWVGAHYPVSLDRADTGIGGSSLGALAAIEAVRRFPDRFSRLALLSPSVWWDDRVVLRHVATSPRLRPLDRVWLSTGTAEGRDGPRSQQQVRDTQLFATQLVDSQWMRRDTPCWEIPGATHREAAWRDVADAMLLSLFGPATAHQVTSHARAS